MVHHGLEVGHHVLEQRDEVADVGAAGGEVAPHPRAQALGLSHVDDAALAVLEQVAAALGGQRLELRRHAGYDHSYYFIASFVEDHLRHHAAALKGPVGAP